MNSSLVVFAFFAGFGLGMAVNLLDRALTALEKQNGLTPKAGS